MRPLIVVCVLVGMSCIAMGQVISQNDPAVMSYDDYVIYRYILLRRIQDFLETLEKYETTTIYDNSIKRVEGIRPVTLIPVAATPPACKQIGEYCTYHQDCCSKACLSYWGKCVSG